MPSEKRHDTYWRLLRVRKPVPGVPFLTAHGKAIVRGDTCSCQRTSDEFCARRYVGDGGAILRPIAVLKMQQSRGTPRPCSHKNPVTRSRCSVQVAAHVPGSGQLKHSVASARLQVLSGHRTHGTDGFVLRSPAGHGRHSLCPTSSATRPPGHATQVSDRPFGDAALRHSTSE